MKKANVEVMPEFSILAAVRIDQAMRDRIDPASVPVRLLEEEAREIANSIDFIELAGGLP